MVALCCLYFEQSETQYGCQVNVVCNRCSAQYEFDDALVSRRGTTVKCTHCGHQFRVRALGPLGPAQDDRWYVHKADGTKLTFSSLRDLQLAIGGGHVQPADHFSRDGRRFRRLGDVEELSSFFGRASLQPGRGEVLTAVAGDSAGRMPRPASDVVPLSSPERHAEPPPPRSTRAERTVSAPTSGAGPRTPARISARPRPDHRAELFSADLLDRITPDLAPPPLPKERSASGSHWSASGSERSGSGSEGGLARTGAAQAASGGATAAAAESGGLQRRGRRRGSAPAAPAPLLPAPAPPPLMHVPEERAASGASSSAFGPLSSPPLEIRPTPVVPAPSLSAAEGRLWGSEEVASQDSSYEALSSRMIPSSIPPPRSGGFRWVVGLLLLGALVLVGVTLGRSYLTQFASRETESVTDRRLAEYLRQGREQLHEGELEAAKAQFDRASGLAEGHPLVAEAQLDVALLLAEREWLRTQLLPEQDGPLWKRAQTELERRLGALAEVMGAASGAEVPRGKRAAVEVDSLRMAGKIPEARAALANVGAVAESEHDYSLAALDMADGAPDFQLVVRRLRAAMAAEGKLGRAAPALVVALQRLGEMSEANLLAAQLATPPAHPMASELSLWLKQLPGEASQGPADAIESSPSAKEAPSPARGAAATRSALELAREARQAGDWPTARRYFQAAVQSNPRDLEALTGLGQAARALGSMAEARSHFGAVLRMQGNYAPAQHGYADIAWSQGHRSEAVKLYRQLIAEGAATAQEKERVAEFEGAASPAAGDRPATERGAGAEESPGSVGKDDSTASSTGEQEPGADEPEPVEEGEANPSAQAPPAPEVESQPSLEPPRAAPPGPRPGPPPSPDDSDLP